MPDDQFTFGHAFISWLRWYCSGAGMPYDRAIEAITSWGRGEGYPSYVAQWDERQCLAARDWLKDNAPGRPEQGGNRGGVPASERAPEAVRVPSSGVGTDRPRGTPPGAVPARSYGERLIDWIESHDPREVDRDLMRTKLELWAEQHGNYTRVADWDKPTAKAGCEYLDSAVMAGMFTPAPPTAPTPVGNIHVADPDRETFEIGEGGEVANDDSVHGGRPRKPAVDRMPDPPKPGRVQAWARDLETRSGIAIKVPWKHHAWAALKDEINPSRALDDYNDRERDLFYKFALWCLGFDAGPAAEPGKPDDPAELRSAILDLAERLIRVQSEVGRAPDEEPIKSVDRKTIGNLLLYTYRDAFKRLNRSEGPNTFDIATNQDWPVLDKMRDILRLRLSELENELAHAREDRAARPKGGKRSA